MEPASANPARQKAGGLATRRLSRLVALPADQTLTSGPREAGPLEPPPPLGPPGFGLRDAVLRLRAPGSFSGLGVTGPSTNSKPILSPAPALASSLTSTTRTWPPPFKWPNRTSSASGFL